MFYGSFWKGFVMAPKLKDPKQNLLSACLYFGVIILTKYDLNKIVALKWE